MTILFHEFDEVTAGWFGDEADARAERIFLATKSVIRRYFLHVLTGLCPASSLGLETLCQYEKKTVVMIKYWRQKMSGQFSKDIERKKS